MWSPNDSPKRLLYPASSMSTRAEKTAGEKAIGVSAGVCALSLGVVNNGQVKKAHNVMKLQCSILEASNFSSSACRFIDEAEKPPEHREESETRQGPIMVECPSTPLPLSLEALSVAKSYCYRSCFNRLRPHCIIESLPIPLKKLTYLVRYHPLLWSSPVMAANVGSPTTPCS